MSMRPLDLGRVAVVPLATVLAAGNVVTSNHDASAASPGDVTSLLRLLAAVLVVVFYGMVAVLYLRRGHAASTTGSVPAKLAAVIASWLPLTLGFIGGRAGSARVLFTATVLLAGGMAWSLASLRTLGGSFSIIAQARAVVDSGPYAVVRHPLYLGELVAALGVVMRAPSGAGFMIWVALLGLQVYRTRHEERVLIEALPAYGAYRATTRWRIVPGVL